MTMQRIGMMLALTSVLGISAFQVPTGLPLMSAAAGPITAISRIRGGGRMLIKGEVDEEALFAASTFPIKPADLIKRAKQVLEVGIGTKDGGACLAPDFEFCAAVVGPLGRAEYLAALGSFKLEDAFPDLNPNYYGFRVDPFEPNRVWFTSRSTATHTGKLLGKPPTGKKLVLPPQQFHLDFTVDGLVKEIGFYTVDRRQGNTGGLGGAFGFFYGTGDTFTAQPSLLTKRGSCLVRRDRAAADLATCGGRTRGEMTGRGSVGQRRAGRDSALGGKA